MTKYLQIYLDAVVLIGFRVVPTSTISADHVCTMTDRTEVEAIVFTGYDLFVAHSNCYPIRVRLFDFEGYFFDG